MNHSKSNMDGLTESMRRMTTDSGGSGRRSGELVVKSGGATARSSTISSSASSRRSTELSGASSSSAAANHPHTSPYSLSNLDIVSTVGTGTFARVVLAKRKDRHQDYVAVKVLAMSEVVRLKQQVHLKNEIEVLKEIAGASRYAIRLLDTFKSGTFIYLAFPYLPGGELFTYLKAKGWFSPETALFYSAELVSLLDYLHAKGIAYRDIKPENLLLDSEGHLRVTDFGFAKRIGEGRTFTLCGTPEYLAPEVILGRGHGLAVDWWATGILVYEMLLGYPPFFDENPIGIYQKILWGRIAWPRILDPTAKDFIKKLLQQNPNNRLGGGPKGGAEVKRHRWFRGVDWDAVENGTWAAKPPIKPKVEKPGDVSNYEAFAENDFEEWKKANSYISDMERFYFEDF